METQLKNEEGEEPEEQKLEQPSEVEETKPTNQEVPEEEQEQESEQEQEESSKSTKIPVTEYGIKRGESACPVCQRAYKFFQSPKMKRYFNFKYADLLNERNRKVADREGFDSMPFFKVKEDDKWEFIVGFNEVDWQEMIERKKKL